MTRDEIFYSPNVRELLGFHRGWRWRRPTIGSERIHPEQERFLAYQSCLGRAIFVAKRRRFFCEVRYRRADGSIELGASGARHWRSGPVAVGSSAWSGRRATLRPSRPFARERDEARTRLSVALESISQGFALFDAEDRLVMCNEPVSPVSLPKPRDRGSR